MYLTGLLWYVIEYGRRVRRVACHVYDPKRIDVTGQDEDGGDRAGICVQRPALACSQVSGEDAFVQT